MIWKFEEFVRGTPGSDKGIISDDLETEANAVFDVILTEHLGLKPSADWCAPDYIPIGGGMGEIRWTCKKIEYRAYGSFENGNIFRIWVIATKSRQRKGKQKTDPPNAIEKARKRKRNFDNQGIGRVRAYE